MSEWACSVDWPKAFGVLKEIVVALAAIATASVAWKGINKWRSEESGKADFDLARRLGKALFKFRDDLKDARAPLVSNSEYPAGIDMATATDEKKAEAYAFAFNARWQPVQSAAIDLRLISHEAEALWGAASRAAVDRVLFVAHVLRISMGAYVRNVKNGGRDFANKPDLSARIDTQLFDAGGYVDDDGNLVEGNPLTKELDAAIEDLMRIVRSKLPSHS